MPFERIEDFHIHKEKELFAGQVSTSQFLADLELTLHRRIVDDHYEHGLRLFQERDTGVIRLQASVQTGEVKRQVCLEAAEPALALCDCSCADIRRKPIWTAFITHQITSSIWMSRDSRRVVHLAELNRHVFTDEYLPQRTHTGAHELTFIHTSGMFFFILLFLPAYFGGREPRGLKRCINRVLIQVGFGADAEDFVENIKKLAKEEQARRKRARARSRSRSRSRGRQG